MRLRTVIMLVTCLGIALTRGPDALAAADAQADPAAGQKVFGRCAGCHSIKPGENRIGPSLAGVFGRPSGSAEGFNYSPAMKNAHLVWDEATLDKFLANPNAEVHGTRMFVALPSADERRNVIAFLKTLSPQAAQGK
jgi:cytochrome c